MAVPTANRERVSRYLPPQGPAVVDHSGRAESAIPARDFFLHRVKANEQVVNKLFDAAGQFIYSAEKPPQNLYTMEPLTLDQYLREQLDPIYSVINGSLDESRPNLKGFNKHDTPHIDRVTYGAMALIEQMQQLGMSFSQDDMRDMIIASRLHDLGNLLTRSDHSAIGVDIALLAIPQLGERQDRIDKIRDIVYYHDEPRIRDAIKAHEEQTGKYLDADAAVDFFQKEFGVLSPGLLAIIMADKTDITRERFSLKAAQAADPDDCLQDQHLLLNFFLETAHFAQGMTETTRGERGFKFPLDRESGFSADGTSFRWKLSFNPGMKKDEKTFFRNLVRHSREENGEKPRAHIPKDVYDLYDGAGIPVLSTIEARLWRLYWDRIQFTIISAFALNPSLQTFSFELFDPANPANPASKSGTQRVEVFERGSLEMNFNRLRQMYFPKNEREGSRRGAH
ncbi:MAG: hypothetical protein KGL95_04120 [Patescibacteria group bacterium]|nr:hypothetical protein [Patescibacteria group bacterium]